MRDKTAYLYNKDRYTFFRIADQIVKFETSPYLSRYTKVKEYDKGYIVVDAEYFLPDNVNNKYTEEDYIDMEYIMNSLGMSTDSLSEVKEVVII